MAIEGYRDLTRLHEGGQAVVYRARREADGLAVILKVLRGPYPTAEAQARFRREAEITRSTGGDGVIGLHDSVLEGDQPFLVLEDFGGRSLADHFDGPVAPARAIRLTLAVVAALSRVHSLLVLHKDIGPSNIVWNSETDELKLIDFGVASTVSRQRPALASPEVIRGTLAYISPEQTGRMNRTVDYRSDYYSLGATLYELLTGSPPFSGGDALELVHAHVARQPRDPRELLPDLPANLAAVVMKLLAKTAEGRYQSAIGLETDLRRCLRTIEGDEPDHAFPLGLHDRPSHVQIPERLYGRGPEVARLVAAVERAEQGGREFVLVSGYSGVGKTSLVHEVHKPLAGRRSLFLTGKFDQYRRGTPYASLASAFGQFCLRLMTGSEVEVEYWRERLGSALGEGAAVLSDLVPELELLLGAQPEPAIVPPSEAEIRLHVLFQRFVRALAAREHPLVLFVADLQWADLPTIRLLEVLVSDLGLTHLLILGAYRDNEVDASHPLTHAVESLASNGMPVEVMDLQQLTPESVSLFVRDALRAEGSEVDDLARVCFDKTGGNPFFLTQFLLSLEETGALSFDAAAARWSWDPAGIDAAGATENVVDLMAGKILRLPEAAGRALCTASILGNDFRIDVLERVSRVARADLEAALGPALEEGLLIPLESDAAEADRAWYVFSHDRVQQAAYGLLPEQERQSVHRRIGQLVRDGAEDLEHSDAIFEVTEHLNAARPLLFADERVDLARLNLVAARRARTNAANGAARSHSLAGIRLLGPEGWADHYELTCELRLEAATAAYLVRLFDEADEHVVALLDRALEPATAVRALEVRMASRIAQNLTHEAIRTGIEALALLGVELAESPDLAAVGAAMVACGERLATVDLAALAAGPEATDAVAKDAMRLLMSLTPPAYLVTPLLMPLLAANIVRLTADHGLARESAYGFSLYGLVLCGGGFVEPGNAMGSFGVGLAERFPEARRESVRARHVHYGFVRHWKEPISAILPAYADLFHEAVAAGDYEYAGFCGMLYSMLAFHSGRPLSVLEPEMTRYTESMGIFQQNISLALHCVTHQAGINLMGEADDPLILTGRAYDEGVMIPMFRQIGDPTCLFVSHLFKTILAFILGEEEAAWETLQVAMANEAAGGTATFHLPVVFTLHALLALRRYEASGDEALLAAAGESRSKVEAWAAVNPSNLAQKTSLMAAEWARVEGDHAAAMGLYEQAIAHARRNGFLSDEALSNESAARFYLARGSDTIARAFLLEARFAYSRWGAAAKVRQLDDEFPEWLASLGAGALSGGTTTRTLGTSVGQDLDAEAVIRASRAISQEIVLANLVRTLITLALESSGARKAVLLLIRDGRFAVAAEGLADPEVYIEVHEPPSPERVAQAVPEALAQYVHRTGKEVLLVDARKEGLFTTDRYVLAGDVRSVLALPVAHKGEMNAVLYLENDRTAGVFTGERLSLARILLAQAAISIDNAVLYESLEEKVRERTRALEEAQQESERAHQRSDAILKNVLPAPIAEELKAAGAAKPVYFESASVLFTDFVGFTELSASLSPAELVDELERCFDYFDEVMERHGVEKLKTIGDAYMAAGGIPEPNRTHPVDLILAAIEVADYIDRGPMTSGRARFAVRLGIHTGPLVAGVIGRKRFLYDVWGDTVNTASRLEHAAEPGRINISAATHETAQHLFECERRGAVPVKGKGAVEMFFVERIRPEYSADARGRTPNEAFARRLAELTG